MSELNATCPECGAALVEREKKSKRPGEILLICERGHKRQGRLVSGYLHLYRSNYPGMVGEGRKQVAVTASIAEKELMSQRGVMPQDVWNLGIDTLRNKQ